MTSYGAAAAVGQMMKAGFVTPFAPATLRPGVQVDHHGDRRIVSGLLVKIDQGENKALVIISRRGEFTPVWMRIDRLSYVRKICTAAEAELILRQLSGSFC